MQPEGYYQNLDSPVTLQPLIKEYLFNENESLPDYRTGIRKKIIYISMNFFQISAMGGFNFLEKIQLDFSLSDCEKT